MQILLTEDEYAGLVPKAKAEEANVAIAMMRDLILDGRCIHDPKSEKRFTYCCQCPLSDLRHPKAEEAIPRHLSKLMCSRSRDYPQ